MALKWSIMSDRPLNVEEYPLNDPLSYRRSLDHDEGQSVTMRSRGLHYASIAEKKRLWWRNAIVNALFISSWCVAYLISLNKI